MPGRVRVELELIARELTQHEPLLRKIRLAVPDRFEADNAHIH